MPITTQDIKSYVLSTELRTLEVINDTSADPIYTNETVGDIHLLNYINLALLDLTIKFRMNIKEQIIDTVDNITDYTLNDDFIVPIDCYDETGVRLPINDDENYNGVFITGYNTLQLPNPATGYSIAISYIASPTKVNKIGDSSVHSPSTNIYTVVPLSDVFLEPILQFIGFKAYSSLDNELNKPSNTYYMRYKTSLKELEQLGIKPNDTIIKNSYRDSGWI